MRGCFWTWRSCSSAQQKAFTALAEALRDRAGRDRLLYVMVEAPVWQGSGIQRL